MLRRLEHPKSPPFGRSEQIRRKGVALEIHAESRLRKRTETFLLDGNLIYYGEEETVLKTILKERSRNVSEFSSAGT